jgi:hypothetical protein
MRRMTGMPPGLRGERYPPEVKEKALELAAAIGIVAAGERLDIPFQSIHRWTQHPDYSERWVELRRVNAPKWRARAAVKLENLVDEYGELQAKALRRANEEVDELPAKDVGNFLRSVAWAQSTAADQAGRLRGQPAQIVEHRVNSEQLEASMQRLLSEAVDSTAEEVPPEALEE